MTVGCFLNIWMPGLSKGEVILNLQVAAMLKHDLKDAFTQFQNLRA